MEEEEISLPLATTTVLCIFAGKWRPKVGRHMYMLASRIRVSVGLSI